MDCPIQARLIFGAHDKHVVADKPFRLKSARIRLSRRLSVILIGLFWIGWIGLSTIAASAAPPEFLAFESGPVRPMALSLDGSKLYAVNTPDGYLEVFSVDAAGLTAIQSIPVGLEPVAVATRANGEVWVVNHLSDSLSVIDPAAGRVVRTLLVGDEPRDILYAGAGVTRAFITTAHRGQHRVDPSIAAVPGAGDPQLTTEGIGRGDVWLFDLARGSERRLTDHIADESDPQWSADEKTIYFFRAQDLFQIDLAGDGEPAPVVQNGNQKQFTHTSIDGTLLFEEITDSFSDLHYLDPASGEVATWLAGPADDRQAQFSPDGNWVTYQSDESGREEIYVIPWPDGGGRPGPALGYQIGPV